MTHLKAKMVCYHIYFFQINTVCECYVIHQTLQNGKTLGQFFEQLYSRGGGGRNHHLPNREIGTGVNNQNAVPPLLPLSQPLHPNPWVESSPNGPNGLRSLDCPTHIGMHLPQATQRKDYKPSSMIQSPITPEVRCHHCTPPRATTYPQNPAPPCAT